VSWAAPTGEQPVAATDALQHVKRNAISDGSTELVHRCRARRRVRRASRRALCL
jgi:hypothetical protein